MSKVTVAAVQMTYGLENAMEKVREAASQGAQIILLPELFENWYFCQENLTLIDDIGSSTKAGKQFITLESKNGITAAIPRRT